MSFSVPIETALRNAGWHPERKLSLEEMKSWCVISDYSESPVPLVIHPIAYAVLQEFGGLQIAFGADDATHILNFDPHEAMTGWFDYGWIVGQPIFPIAIYHPIDDDSNIQQIGIDAAGRIWLMAYELFFIGQNIHEAIEFLGARFSAVEIPEPYESDDYETNGDEADAVRRAIVSTLKRSQG